MKRKKLSAAEIHQLVTSFDSVDMARVRDYVHSSTLCRRRLQDPKGLPCGKCEPCRVFSALIARFVRHDSSAHEAQAVLDAAATKRKRWVTWAWSAA